VSGAPHAPKGPITRLVQLVALAAVFGLYWLGRHLAPEAPTSVSVIGAIGFAVVGGTLASELLETIGIPHLTAYIALGVLAGPHVTHLLDHDTVESMRGTNTLALSLIALAGGAELRLELVKKGLRSLAWSTLLQSTLVLVAMALVFAASRPLMPFLAGASLSTLAGVALLWGTLAISRSPSATLGILSQTRAKGPVASHTLAFVMTSDVVVVVVAALVITLVKPLLLPGAELSATAFDHLWHEVVGSVALGTTLGLLLVAYLKFIGRSFVIVLVALGYGFAQVLGYLKLEALLTFLVAGFLVQNLSSQGEKFLHAIEDVSSVVFVVFFTGAGAHLDLPLMRELWQVAVVLCACRALSTIGVNALATKIAGDPPSLRRWGWSGLVSQAGVTLALSATIEKAFPVLGSPFRSLVIATVGLNEVAGPILFKLALDRAGETSTSPEQTRAELEEEEGEGRA
jgi:Kef-type K+ transport system membrane component KefB